MAAPRLLLTIDVEEDMPDWKITDPTTAENARALPALAELCDSLGVKPTYLCDYPMVTMPEPARILGGIAARGNCEVGAHLHPWNTPPYRGVPGLGIAAEEAERKIPYYIFQLGPEHFSPKLESLTKAIAQIAPPPASFRAGRYGIDAATLGVLPRHGYTTDTSVTPLVHHSSDGGPDFRFAPDVPYFPDSKNICERGTMTTVEVPVSITLTRRLPAALRNLYVQIPSRTRVRGLLSKDYLGLVDLVWLYPAKYDMASMTRAARTIAESGNPNLNVFLHSSELIPGASQLVRTEADAKGCFERLRGILQFCIQQLGATPATLAEAGAAAR
jgi:hypothetical protein